MNYEYDVVVAGGGTTGCCAAIAAARRGARVLLIEKLPFLGGNMTGGLPWLGFHSRDGKPVVGGLPLEIIEKLRACGGATDFIMDPITGSAVGVNGTMLKLMLARLVEESGADVLLHSLVTGVQKEGNRVTAVQTADKGGGSLIACKQLIDCTDSADAAVLAGGSYVLGRAGDGQRQVSSNVMIFGEIDFGEMLSYFRAHPDQIRPFPLSGDVISKLLHQMETAPVFVLGAFEKLIGEAKAAGAVYGRRQLIGVAYPLQRELMLVSSRVTGVDLNDVRSHTQAELEGLRQSWGILDLLHNSIPGCGNARIVSSGTQLGIREARHVVGDHTLTADDLLAGRRFKDAVCQGAYHMDIHSPDHDGLETNQLPVYTVPLRSLLVKGLENVQVAGRGISATHEAMSSTRVAPISAAQGQAAGTAAALAEDAGKALRDMAAQPLYTALLEDGVIL